MKETIWGGDILGKCYNKAATLAGESWELCNLGNDKTCIADGNLAGSYLSDQIKSDFPVIIKFIDAASKLSVQVHPDSEAAKQFGGLPKNELWYIIKCTDDAEIIYGTQPSATADEIADAIKNGNINYFLKNIKVKAGDCFYIPEGQIHAIGKGILLLEIQQASDTTYRIDDYGRIDKNGNTRMLHLEEAAASVKIRADAEIEELRYKYGKTGKSCIANCDYFYCEAITVSDSKTFSYSKTDYSLTCTRGNGEIIYNNTSYKINCGDTYFIPSQLSEITVKGDLNIILTSKKEPF